MTELQLRVFKELEEKIDTLKETALIELLNFAKQKLKNGSESEMAILTIDLLEKEFKRRNLKKQEMVDLLDDISEKW